MANIKSAKKRIKITTTKTLRNKIVKSGLKTVIKNFELAIEAGNKEEAASNYKSVVKALDMAVSKNVLHKNKAGRKKSRLAAKLNTM